MPVHERVEIDWIEIISAGVSETRNVAIRYRIAHPMGETLPFFNRSNFTSRFGDGAQASKRRNWERRQDGVAYTQKSLPGDVVARNQTLTRLGERHGGEIEHRLRGEQVEVRHRLVTAGNDEIDLIRFRGERGGVASEHVGIRNPPIGRRAFAVTIDAIKSGSAS